jgi:hypothetical protein
VHRVRFHVHKVDKRQTIEDVMQASQHSTGVGKKAATSNHLSGPLSGPVRLRPSDFERAKAAAPGWDVYYLEQEWRDWLAKRRCQRTPARPLSISAVKNTNGKEGPERNGSTRAQES